MVIPYVAAQSINDDGHLFSNLKFSANLAVTTDTTLTVPGISPRYKAIIKCEQAGVVWVANNAVAAAPAGASFASTTSELITEDNTLNREVKAGDVLHFFSTAANVEVSVVFYSLYAPN